jgi:adenylate cyclase
MPQQATPEEVEALWRNFLTTGDHRANMPEIFKWRTLHRVFAHIPAAPRCRVCYAPFKGVGGQAVRLLFNRGPSRMNPQMCNACEQVAETYPGGAEVELTVLFADVRGSTTMAEAMSARDFSTLISRFYDATTEILYQAGALVEKMIGDEVTGLFTPGLAGSDHAAAALKAARDILAATGNVPDAGSTDPAAAPWVPVGVGLHSGLTYVGSVGTNAGPRDIAALGDTMNVGARLASLARAGQIVLSDATARAAGLDTTGLSPQDMQLKGRAESVKTWVLGASA